MSVVEFKNEVHVQYKNHNGKKIHMTHFKFRNNKNINIKDCTLFEFLDLIKLHDINVETDVGFSITGDTICNECDLYHKTKYKIFILESRLEKKIKNLKRFELGRQRLELKLPRLCGEFREKKEIVLQSLICNIFKIRANIARLEYKLTREKR